MERAFAEMFDAHYGAVLGYGLRRVDAATAHDVAAETFLVAWRRWDGPPEDPRSWLLAVARRVLANELRRRARADRLDDRLGRVATVGGPATVQPDPARRVTEMDHLRAAFGALSARDREVLQLIAWEELDHRQAAAVLGCSVAALKVRVHRARRRLQALLRADDDTEGSVPRQGPVLIAVPVAANLPVSMSDSRPGPKDPA